MKCSLSLALYSFSSFLIHTFLSASLALNESKCFATSLTNFPSLPVHLKPQLKQSSSVKEILIQLQRKANYMSFNALHLQCKGHMAVFELIRMTIREQKEETRRKVPGKERGSESEEDGGGWHSGTSQPPALLSNYIWLFVTFWNYVLHFQPPSSF